MRSCYTCCFVICYKTVQKWVSAQQWQEKPSFCLSALPSLEWGLLFSCSFSCDLKWLPQLQAKRQAREIR